MESSYTLEVNEWRCVAGLANRKQTLSCGPHNVENTNSFLPGSGEAVICSTIESTSGSSGATEDTAWLSSCQLLFFFSICLLHNSNGRAEWEYRKNYHHCGNLSPCSTWVSHVVKVVKNLPANAGDLTDAFSIPGLGWSPGGEHGNPLQYSCLENVMDRGVWWAIVHRVSKGRIQLKRLSTHACTQTAPISVTPLGQ